jgi:hypothetical protein
MLLHRPETGVGYQIVDAVVFPEFISTRFVVYNSELAINLDTEFEYYKYIIFRDGYLNVINARSTLAITLRSFVLVKGLKPEKPIDIPVDLIKNKQRHQGDKGAKENPVEYANGKELFIRLSAYENDKRIDFEKKRLRPGSFTTTEKDYGICILVNDDPVDRYALPNDEQIKFAFYIQPKVGDILQRGIVQPAFNHYGGGIEAYFENGTSDNTYLFRRDYGK